MEHLNKRPAKGILKTKSIEQPDPPKQGDIKWDEMNILQTLHPPDKDYGFMKIDEPKTPYSYEASDEADGTSEQTKPIQSDKLDCETLARKMSTSDRRLSIDDSACVSGDDDDGEQLTEEARMRKKEFEIRRRSHYNEFQAVKLARQLLEEEKELEDDDDTGDASSNPGSMTTQ